MPAVRRQRIRMGTKGARRHGLHRRVPPHARSRPKDRQGAQRPFARVLLQLDGHCQPHPRIQLHQDVALPEHRRGPNPRNDAPEPQRRRADGRHDARRRAQGRRAGTRGGDREAQDADPPGRRHALPDAHGAPVGYRWQSAPGADVRTQNEPPLGLGLGDPRSRAQVELHRVAGTDRPLDG